MLRDQRIVTARERFTTAFTGWGAMRILVETGTESEWVAQTLEAAGHEVVVADPNYAPMYGELTRTVKTDRRDIAALAEANRRGWYRPAHRSSATQRETKQMLRSRRFLVQTLTTEIHAIDARLQTRTADRGDDLPRVRRSLRPLRSWRPGQAAIGLVPREDSSAERRQRGHITKAGPRELRSLIVQAAWVCWRHPGSGTLRAWVDRLAGRRGRRIAVVALARRLSRILFAMWRDGTTFDGRKLAAA